MMRNAGYKFYEHHIDRRKYQINGKELVLMDRYHNHPWFYQMSKGELFLMDGELSMMLELCGGNLSQAIQNMSWQIYNPCYIHNISNGERRCAAQKQEN